MTNLLAVDTTTDACSVALAHLESVPDAPRTHKLAMCLEDTRFAPRLHGEQLLPMIDGLLGNPRAGGVNRGDLNVVAFNAGPASFTGVRIGAAVAQGLAFAVGAAVIAVPSSDVAAEAVRLATGCGGERWLSRPAHAGMCYTARYRFGKTAADRLGDERLVPAEELAEDVIRCDPLAASARLVAALAARRLDAKVPPAEALPIHLEGDQRFGAKR